jgi:TPP-dependent pyruvate/acetoin dehydrogenase alpha subunit
MSAPIKPLTRYQELFKACLRIRLVEESIVSLYPFDRIQSPVHLSIGQEAIAVGSCEPLKSSDLLFATYRGHAFYLAKGGNLRLMFAELFGKATGFAKGKAGSMHLAAPEVGMMGCSAVVGSNLPHAAGASLAARNRGTGQICICAFGDGATEEGVYHETLNFVALEQLPMILLCEDNGLAVHASKKQRHSYKIPEHVRCFGIETIVLNEGWDVLKIADTMAQIVGATRADGKPRFMQVQTYRYKEHVGPGDDFDAGYRFQSDLLAWQAKDQLIQDSALVERFTPEIKSEIADAVTFAESSPDPDLENLLTDVI